ncbi:hypothetical protein BDV96DRAFT_654776 [Lophiotrema nucula]|uniref:Heterokaryon incompatibility domain-containing protein n=1 Tax=Lophiotrema nucula TaxID=690887 RepID=A0A6A5YHH2_9PLEO|nr:hypothetical protein BDV96DRAFT_654776 [Lophiotrema nucula]
MVPHLPAGLLLLVLFVIVVYWVIDGKRESEPKTVPKKYPKTPSPNYPKTKSPDCARQTPTPGRVRANSEPSRPSLRQESEPKPVPEQYAKNKTPEHSRSGKIPSSAEVECPQQFQDSSKQPRNPPPISKSESPTQNQDTPPEQTDLDQIWNARMKYHPQPFLTDFDPKKHIRLLRVLPAPDRYDDSSPVMCQFIKPYGFSTRSWPRSKYTEYTKYTALSYEWGPASKREHIFTIYINDEPFIVRRNLFDFLYQSNPREKGPQLELMPKIYEKASVVSIWLGKTNDSTLRDGLHYLRECTRYGQIQWGPTHTELIDPMLEFLVRNTYWTRLWIVQEVYKASRLELYTGTLCWEFCDLKRLREAARMFSEGWDTEYTWRFWINIVEAKEGWQRKKHRLHDVLYQWSHHECRDIHDKVYGLLGLVSGTKLRVDLDKTLPDLFSDVLRLESWSIYAKGYVYADEFATKLLHDLQLSKNSTAQQTKLDFLRRCMVPG